jgi:Ca2+-binding RTX toxin-like protein
VYRTGDGPTDVNLVGNTVVRSHANAFYVYDTAAGGRLSLDVFNNIFAKAAYRGLYLESTGASLRTVRAGFNDLWRNDRRAIWDGASPGTGNRNVDPRFADAANGEFRLRRSSPLIDAGLTCSPGGVAVPDQAGRSRLAGTRVDMGAIERGAAPADGKALVGTGGADNLEGSSGADILCGMGGDDSLSGFSGPDFVDGGNGADVLVGGPGGDRLVGRAGSDVIVGGRGPDHIYGGHGPDPCLNSEDGVKGNDLIDGGAGRDGYRADRRDTVRSVERRSTCFT